MSLTVLTRLNINRCTVAATDCVTELERAQSDQELAVWARKWRPGLEAAIHLLAKTRAPADVT